MEILTWCCSQDYQHKYKPWEYYSTLVVLELILNRTTFQVYYKAQLILIKSYKSLKSYKYFAKMRWYILWSGVFLKLKILLIDSAACAHPGPLTRLHFLKKEISLV